MSCQSLPPSSGTRSVQANAIGHCLYRPVLQLHFATHFIHCVWLVNQHWSQQAGVSNCPKEANCAPANSVPRAMRWQHRQCLRRMHFWFSKQVQCGTSTPACRSECVTEAGYVDSSTKQAAARPYTWPTKTAIVNVAGRESVGCNV